ncbi:HPr-rel-A system PqqD family peptide chaperone [Thiocystis violacea]|uniref:HPr-rel-A system PqqD family peptide chaperone n=1 Tax=Thiocystis violacea TaxID=13725 RepID=UPI001906322C|nr:HPr-rel-A system PqqD family peptide chaperone [Thiocystis violacea]MBK1724731.1 hypothetical protein [Thiocystis violacea]
MIKVIHCLMIKVIRCALLMLCIHSPRSTRVAFDDQRGIQTSDLMTYRQARFQVAQSSLVDLAWENERLVYCLDSGETHFLNATGAQILDHLTSSPLSFENLLACITSVDEVSNSETLAADLSSFLDRFVELGILVSCPVLSDA